MGLSNQFSRLLLLCLIPLVKAYTVFETSCSTPSTLANFVSSPDTRGTLDILWSSLFTIIACTWTLQHPNIPEERNGRYPGRLGDLKWWLKRFCKDMTWMIITVIAPEVIISAAFFDLLAAHHNCERLKAYAKEDDITWSLSHSYYANMGGFVIRSTPAGEGDYHDPYHLDAEDIYNLRHNGILQNLPYIATEEIEDKSKGDGLVKVIAVGQIIWTTMQILVRAARRLAVSPLEIATVAFAVGAIIIYGLYWKKPQRAYTTKTILPYEATIPEEALRMLKRTRSVGHFVADILFRNVAPHRRRLPGSPISIDSLKALSHSNRHLVMSAGAVGAAIFGGIHVVAWNFAFPSAVELTFWRCASIYSAVSPLYLLLIVISCELSQHFYFSMEKFIGVTGYALPFLGCLYVVARLFIIVEIFRTLCFLPPGSFVSTWTSNIPHIA
ncbi:hypothetical protein V8C37DRAFT_417714 [Trichoderma ceciliae]